MFLSNTIVGLIAETFFYLVILLLVIRLTSAKMKKMQRKRRVSKFDENKYSNYWKRKH